MDSLAICALPDPSTIEDSAHQKTWRKLRGNVLLSLAMVVTKAASAVEEGIPSSHSPAQVS